MLWLRAWRMCFFWRTKMTPQWGRFDCEQWARVSKPVAGSSRLMGFLVGATVIFWLSQPGFVLSSNAPKPQQEVR